MSVKPTRSEIEDSVAGRAAPKRGGPMQRSDSVELQLDSMTARRQHVIGGDLTGVSKRQAKSRFGDLNNTNWINWTAAGIVLLIVAVFFWPNSSNDTTREVAGLSKQIEAAPYYNEARIDDEPVAQVGNSFNRETDLERAEEYRELDARETLVRQLLATAETHIAKGEYTLPPGKNATFVYKQILQEDPKNSKARQGLNYISNRFLTSGYEAIQQNNEAAVTTSLGKLATIDRESEAYLELSQAVDNWKINRQIGKLQELAKAAAKQNKLILPARQNALYYYQQILVIDESNQSALDGIQSVADWYIDRANSALLAGQYEAATGYLATVSVIDSKHPSIPLLEEMISKAEPLARSGVESRTQASRSSSQDRTANRANSGNEIAANAIPSTNTPRQPAQARNSASASRTPRKEANEQAAFDREYLQRGLDAYYRGEYKSAAALLQPLADKGVSRAQFRIAYMHYLGRGFKKDTTEADRLIRAALPAVQNFADQGRGWAQSDIGSLYEDGLVLGRDYGEAVYWYRSAAEQGYPGAQTNLGIMYARGRGVSSSRRTAIEWFQRAAKQGDISAKRNLEVMGISP